MKLLITRPGHYDTVSYLFEWSKALIERTEKKAIGVLDCSKERANKATVAKLLEKHNPG